MSELLETQNGYKTPFFYVVTVIVMITMSLSGWSFLLGIEQANQITLLDNQVQELEESQFTRVDAARMESRIRDQMRDGFDEVKKCIRGTETEACK